MRVLLELHKRKREKNAKHQLVIRFFYNRKLYRYPVGVSLTEAEWFRENKTGYPKTKGCVDMESKAHSILSELKPFDYPEFQRLMKAPVILKDSMTSSWVKYETWKQKKGTAISTRAIEKSAKLRLTEFLLQHPEYDNIHVFTPEVLEEFRLFLIDQELSVTTSRIYLIVLRTFFNWVVNDAEIITKSPFKKYRIPKSEQNWYPFNMEELKKIFDVKPTTDKERNALKWTMLLLYSGGCDPIDFVSLKWRSVKSDCIQLHRTKTNRSSSLGRRLLYLTGPVRQYFTEVKAPGQTDNDYVFDIFSKDDSKDQNKEKHKRLLKNINSSMRTMLNDEAMRFTVKRLRPTAAVIAMASTKDLNFVSGMLNHSNISQTDTYIKHYPNELVRINQEIFEEALKQVSKVAPLAP